MKKKPTKPKKPSDAEAIASAAMKPKTVDGEALVVKGKPKNRSART
jgi:hypothetical protein